MRARDEQKEQAIRQKAIELVAEQGLEGFSMQKLAKAAGVSPATLYIYYHDREDLLVRLCTEVSSHILEDSLRDFSPEMSFEEGLRVQWKNRAAYYLNNPLEVKFIEQIRYTHLYEKVGEQLTSTFKEVMGKFMHNAIQRRQVVKLPFEVYWSVAFAPLYQLIKFHWQQRSHVNQHFALTEEVMLQTLQLVLKALKP